MSEPTKPNSDGCKTDVLTCETHGEYTVPHLYGRPMGSCPECEKERTRRKLEEEQELARENQESTIRIILNRSGIPPRFKNRTFDAFRPADEKQAHVLKVCRTYAAKFENRLANGGGLVLCGLPGTGKTHLACAIANAIAYTGRTSLFLSVMQAVRRVKQTYRKDSDQTEADAIASFYRPDLLILDEVGVQVGSETEKLILFEIINGRYEQMRPTILISNLTVGELGAFIGERALDRMKEGGGAVLAFDWKSRRADVATAENPASEVDWERLHNRIVSEDIRL
jgi:DNA replication protein DnaC